MEPSLIVDDSGSAEFTCSLSRADLQTALRANLPLPILLPTQGFFGPRDRGLCQFRAQKPDTPSLIFARGTS